MTEKGGTMRLGLLEVRSFRRQQRLQRFIMTTSPSWSVTDTATSLTTHFKQQLENAGLKATGFNPDTGLVEVSGNSLHHPWFVGVQYHPEYKSTVANPHPLFLAFVRAALNHKTKK